MYPEEPALALLALRLKYMKWANKQMFAPIKKSHDIFFQTMNIDKIVTIMIPSAMGKTWRFLSPTPCIAASSTMASSRDIWRLCLSTIQVRPIAISWMIAEQWVRILDSSCNMLFKPEIWTHRRNSKRTKRTFQTHSMPSYKYYSA